MDGRAQQTCFFSYADNYLIYLKAAVIVDVEATRAIRQAEVGVAKTIAWSCCVAPCPNSLWINGIHLRHTQHEKAASGAALLTQVFDFILVAEEDTEMIS